MTTGETARRVDDPADPDRPDHWAAVVALTPGRDPEATSAALWQAGADGVWQRPGELRGYFTTAPERIGDDRLALLPADTSWHPEPAVDHLAAWRAAARPVRAGGVEVVPHHLADEHATPPGVHRILLDPGQAFGSGHHATTAGCLAALDRLAPAGRTVLDLGTGTGILAIAAAKQGAEGVVGVDTDPHAVAVARRNARDNDVEADWRVAALADVERSFDLVLANLLTSTLVDLADDLPRVLSPGGRLVASGVGVDRAEAVVEAFTRAGLVDVEVRPRDEWVVLVARRADHS